MMILKKSLRSNQNMLRRPEEKLSVMTLRSNQEILPCFTGILLRIFKCMDLESLVKVQQDSVAFRLLAKPLSVITN